ncbi:phosphoribosyl-AMP cyclohydrolase [Lentisphaera profundi]|uniref:Phosphoribosyl-AMP cyclohydrolase n=1 Tax=Lentisphaera profundi TaxID=1658616 RepID=A0ABY7VTE8_9BACT|nr:phosphoribosyl-AMP cyclohydrolase [Lentisphaera profundi]WDE96101.1 phosphoribosyl-AMP cyclohydrolase [Lentisphaera profundi]
MAKVPDTMPDFSKSEDGLIPAVAQDAITGEILMLAYVNKAAWEETLRSKRACYWSRSRSKLWKKGEESGNWQEIKEILVDCDGDSIIYKIEQVGGIACHTGRKSCFFYKYENDNFSINSDPIIDPAQLYKK